MGAGDYEVAVMSDGSNLRERDDFSLKNSNSTPIFLDNPLPPSEKKKRLGSGCVCWEQRWARIEKIADIPSSAICFVFRFRRFRFFR